MRYKIKVRIHGFSTPIYTIEDTTGENMDIEIVNDEKFVHYVLKLLNEEEVKK